MDQNALEGLYSRIRAEEREARASRVHEAYSRAPQLAAVDEKRRLLFADLGARRVDASEAKKRLAQLDAEQTRLLLDAGLPQNALELRYRCEACRDTGYVGETHAPCRCRLLYRERMRGADGINERETFAGFDTEIFSSPEQRRRTINARGICLTYANELPAPAKPNLLLFGMPGLGKSFLLNAIGYAAIERGIDCARVTAYTFVQDILQDIRTHTENARRYQTVPLLLLDDLGSEPDIPNISQEWLFAVINERVTAARPSVCVTNLTLSQLAARYGERLTSRLCDRNTTQVLRLEGENLRTRG